MLISGTQINFSVGHNTAWLSDSSSSMFCELRQRTRSITPDDRGWVCLYEHNYYAAPSTTLHGSIQAASMHQVHDQPLTTLK